MNCVNTVAWLFPGQGSQSVGMSRSLLASYPPATELLVMASEMADIDLVQLVKNGPDTLLTRTDNLQPALTAVSLGCCLMLEEAGYKPDLVAGHSLGEFAALYAAGVITTHDALRLVLARGRLMHSIAATLDGGMLAVIDLDSATVQAIVSGLGEEDDAFGVSIANYNTSSQTVLSGGWSDLERARLAVEEHGGRALKLNVSGPWHSSVLEPAAQDFAELLRATDFQDASTPIVMNASAETMTGGLAIRKVMERQLCSPVRWLQVLRALRGQDVNLFVEVGPGKVLKGLLRGVPEVAQCEAINVDGPNSLRFLKRSLGEAAK